MHLEYICDFQENWQEGGSAHSANQPQYVGNWMKLCSKSIKLFMNPHPGHKVFWKQFRFVCCNQMRTWRLTWPLLKSKPGLPVCFDGIEQRGVWAEESIFNTCCCCRPHLGGFQNSNTKENYFQYYQQPAPHRQMQAHLPTIDGPLHPSALQSPAHFDGAPKVGPKYYKCAPKPVSPCSRLSPQ